MTSVLSILSMFFLRNKMCFSVDCYFSFFFGYSSLAFVPKHKPVDSIDIEKISDFISKTKKMLVLTGAGISTESGIPDYRSEGVGLYARSSSRPVQYQDFVKHVNVRKRYWARNFVGWPKFSSFLPNGTHVALRELELLHRKVLCIVTQNVDGLHTKAGSRNIIELHGSAYKVICLSCDYSFDRHSLQDMMTKQNPHMKYSSEMIRPDGDVELPQEKIEEFKIPECPECKGVLKPNIVFFGENVPRNRVERVKKQVEECDSLLVLGSSLSVFSGYRIILQASELKKPIAIINIGHTRGDSYAEIKLDAKCGDLLPRLKGF